MSSGPLGSLPNYAITVGMTPDVGPRMVAVRAPLVMNAAGTFSEAKFNLISNSALNQLTSVQGVFLDFADFAAANSISLFHVRTGFRLRAKGQTQGWYAMPATDDLEFLLQAPSGVAGAIVPLWFTNAQPPINQWASA